MIGIQVADPFQPAVTTAAMGENQFETILAVKDRMFPEPSYPNWIAVGVTWRAGFDFEIKVIARIPGGA